MDSELDKKLQMIITMCRGEGAIVDMPKHALKGSIFEGVELKPEPIERRVEQIKAAFTQAGWITPEQVAKTQKLVNQMANLANDMAKMPVILRETQLAQPLNDRGFYTGKEWYYRLMAGIEKFNYDNRGSADIDTHHLEDVAKRAAGLTEADNE